MNRVSLAGICSSVALALVGCDGKDEKPVPSASRERSQAVVVAEPASNPAGASAPTTPAHAPTEKAAEGSAEGGAKPAERKPRTLCEPRTGKARRKVSSSAKIERAEASGEKALGAPFPVGQGEVTWVNFWAAWCVPCREEIPRLVAWEKKLVGEGLPFRVVFVSLDDDERQLREFLEKQPGEGLRRTYWLREGAQREEWLTQVGMDPDPRLPIHLLVSAVGEAHCVIEGAIEDEDFDEARRIVRSASR